VKYIIIIYDLLQRVKEVLVYSCEEQWMKPERGLLMEIRPWQKGQGRFMRGGIDNILLS